MKTTTFLVVNTRSISPLLIVIGLSGGFLHASRTFVTRTAKAIRQSRSAIPATAALVVVMVAVSRRSERYYSSRTTTGRLGTPPVGVIGFGGPTDGRRKTNARETLEEAGGAIVHGSGIQASGGAPRGFSRHPSGRSVVARLSI